MEETPITEIKQNRSRRLIGAAVFAAALGGSAVFGMALGSPSSSFAQTDDSTTTTEPDGSDTGGRPDGPGACHGVRGAGLDAAATALGMTLDELRAELEAGKTIATVAEEQGVELQTVIDAMVADASAHIDEAVAAGDLTEEEATEKKADLEARITELVNNPLPAGGPGGPGGPGHHGVRGPGLDAAATALGMTVDELRAELEAGQTIAAVAEAQGVDVQTVIDAMVADASAHIDEAVAAGDLTEEEATEKKADLEARITELVNNEFRGGRPHR